MSIFERLWKDRMDIFRYSETTVNNVTTNTEQRIQQDIKCHYSGGSLTDTGDEGVPTLNNTHMLFCGLNTAKEGDRVVVTQHKSGSVIPLGVGEGFPSGGGMQFSVKRSDTA